MRGYTMKLGWLTEATDEELEEADEIVRDTYKMPQHEVEYDEEDEAED